MEQQIQSPNPNDVILGRGYACNKHPGNLFFRQLVKLHKAEYTQSSDHHHHDHTKTEIAHIIWSKILDQDPPGRFLKRDESTECWFEVEYHEIMKKVKQALREKSTTSTSSSSASTSTSTSNGNTTSQPSLQFVHPTMIHPMSTSSDMYMQPNSFYNYQSPLNSSLNQSIAYPNNNTTITTTVNPYCFQNNINPYISNSSTSQLNSNIYTMSPNYHHHHHHHFSSALSNQPSMMINSFHPSLQQQFSQPISMTMSSSSSSNAQLPPVTTQAKNDSEESYKANYNCQNSSSSKTAATNESKTLSKSKCNGLTTTSMDCETENDNHTTLECSRQQHIIQHEERQQQELEQNEKHQIKQNEQESLLLNDSKTKGTLEEQQNRRRKSIQIHDFFPKNDQTKNNNHNPNNNSSTLEEHDRNMLLLPEEEMDDTTITDVLLLHNSKLSITSASSNHFLNASNTSLSMRSCSSLPWIEGGWDSIDDIVFKK